MDDRIDALLHETCRAVPGPVKWQGGWIWSEAGVVLSRTKAGRALLALGAADRREIVVRLLKRAIGLERRFGASTAVVGAAEPDDDGCDEAEWRRRRTIVVLALNGMLKVQPTADDEVLGLMATWLVGAEHFSPIWYPFDEIVAAFEARFAAGATPPAEVVAAALSLGDRFHATGRDDWRRLGNRLASLVGGAPDVRLAIDRAWAVAIRSELDAMPADNRYAWLRLLTFCQDSRAAKPTPPWIKTARVLLNAVGRGPFREAFARWLPQFEALPDELGSSRFESLPDHPCDIDLWKRLAWVVGMEGDPRTARLLSRLALASYRRLSGIGPRSAAVGNAALIALASMPCIEATAEIESFAKQVEFQKGRDQAAKILSARRSC